MHAADDLARTMGLACDAVLDVEDLGAVETIASEAVDAAVAVTCDRRERLVEFVCQRRGHLAHCHQARGGLQAFILLAGELACVLLFGDVQHRAHPARLAPARIDQRRLEHQHVKLLAVLAPQAHFGAFAGCAACHDLLVQLEGALDALRVPVRHRRLEADELFGAIAGHAAERRIHISEAAIEITRAHAGEQRVFHRLAERRLFEQRGFCALAARELAPQLHHAPHDDAGQQHDRCDEQHRNPARLGAVGGDVEGQAVTRGVEGHAVAELRRDRSDLRLGGDLAAVVVEHGNTVALGEPPWQLTDDQIREGVDADHDAQQGLVGPYRDVDREVRVAQHRISVAVGRTAHAACERKGGVGGQPRAVVGLAVARRWHRAHQTAVGAHPQDADQPAFLAEQVA